MSLSTTPRLLDDPTVVRHRNVLVLKFGYLVWGNLPLKGQHSMDKDALQTGIDDDFVVESVMSEKFDRAFGVLEPGVVLGIRSP